MFLRCCHFARNAFVAECLYVNCVQYVLLFIDISKVDLYSIMHKLFKFCVVVVQSSWNSRVSHPIDYSLSMPRDPAKCHNAALVTTGLFYPYDGSWREIQALWSFSLVINELISIQWNCHWLKFWHKWLIRIAVAISLLLLPTGNFVLNKGKLHYHWLWCVKFTDHLWKGTMYIFKPFYSVNINLFVTLRVLVPLLPYAIYLMQINDKC